MSIRYSTNFMGPFSLDWYKKRELLSIMSIRYSTNFMGPVSLDWYKKRGLLEEGSAKPTTDYCGGRIDIRDSSKPGYDGWSEYSLAPMHGEDWEALSDWLDTFETDDVWTYDQLITQFEKYYGKRIRWAKDLEDWRHIAQ